MSQVVSVAPSEKFVALESCRGICAILVALVHLSANGYFYNLPFIRNGGLGVTYFFVLSGFVMMHAYGGKLQHASQFLPFFVRRFGRLYPLHITVLVVLLTLETVKLALVTKTGLSAGSAPFTGANSIEALFGGVTLTNGLGFFHDFTWNGPSWTISTEFWTYLMFFAVLMTRRAALPLALAIVVLTGLALGFNAIRVRPLRTIEGAGAILCVYCFFLGLICYSSARERLRSLASSKLAEVVALGLIVLAFLDLVPFRPVVVPLIFSFAVVVLSYEGGAVSAALKNRVLVHLGTISYSIYMVHYTILTVVDAVARVLHKKTHLQILREGVGESGFLIDTGQRWHMDLLAMVYLVVLIAVANVTYRFIEVPFRVRFNSIAKDWDGRRSEDRVCPSL